MRFGSKIAAVAVADIILSATAFRADAQEPAPADTIKMSADDIAVPQTTDVPDGWTFEECLNWALANNTDLQRTKLNILLARQDVLSAKDEWLPTVKFTTDQNFVNYPTVESGRKANTYGSSYGIGAEWMVWEGNMRKYRTESAKLVELQRALAGEDVVKNLKIGILQAYLNIMYAQEAVKIAEQTLAISTAQTERIVRLAESGRSSQVDYAQIESQRALDTYSLTQARTAYRTSVMALKRILILGLSDTLSVAPVYFTEEEVLAPLPDMAEVFDQASLWLPQLRSNELARTIYANDVKIAKARALPTIKMQGGVVTGYTSGGARSWAPTMGHNFNENVGVTLSVPLFDGNASNRGVAKARLAELQYDLDRKELLDHLSQTIESLYIDAANAQARYEAGVKKRTAMLLTDELVNNQFELGSASLLDVLTAHNNLLNARLELLQSKFMAIMALKTINYYATQELELK